MERLTTYIYGYAHGAEGVREDSLTGNYCRGEFEATAIVDRLAAIENILGDEYDLDRLRELVQAERLLGKTLYEPNKRGFISTYQVISIHIFEHSVLLGWELLDGMYSNVNGFEISALGEKVFLTREEAEAALRREQDG